MARNDDAQRVSADGSAHCSRRRWLSLQLRNTCGYITVCDDVPIRDLCQSFPNTLLKRGAARRERKLLRARLVSGKITIEPPKRFLEHR